MTNDGRQPLESSQVCCNGQIYLLQQESIAPHTAEGDKGTS
jgi:hypothetical protein